MRSTTTVISTPRVSASASMRLIWWLFPSTRATHWRKWPGSRRCASSKTFPITVAASSTTLAVTHLALARGAAGGAGWLLVTDVGGSAGDRGEVIDGADLGEPFPVAFLAFTEAALELVGRCLGRLRCCWAQGIGAHDDALAVGGDDQHVAGVGLRAGPGGVDPRHRRRPAQPEPRPGVWRCAGRWPV